VSYERSRFIRAYPTGPASFGHRLSGGAGAAPDGCLSDDLPKYLLAPEVTALLHFMPDLRRKMLFTTLWNTGARISEALVLTRGDFQLHQHYPFVQLATLKQREEKAERRAGRRHAGSVSGGK
jgi:integrase